MSAPPTDNGEGEQAYSDITLMSLVLHKEACKMCKFIMRQEFLDRDISWELDKQGKRQYSVTDKTLQISQNLNSMFVNKQIQRNNPNIVSPSELSFLTEY